MKFQLSIVVTLLTLAATVDAAPVTGQISLDGYANPIGSSGFAAASGIDFLQNATSAASPGIAGGLLSFGAGTGSYVGLSCSNGGGTCGTIKDIVNFAASAPISNFLTFNTSTAISFDLLTFTALSRDVSTNSLSLTASGIIHYAGLDDTAGQFILSEQGNQGSTFSATLIAAAQAPTSVPEPDTLALSALGCGLAALGLRRKPAKVGSAQRRSPSA